MTQRRPILAYHDPQFLDSDEARPVRILAEYLEPLRAFREAHVHDTVVFFGSARAPAVRWSTTPRPPRSSPAS